MVFMLRHRSPLSRFVLSSISFELVICASEGEKNCRFDNVIAFGICNKMELIKIEIYREGNLLGAENGRGVVMLCVK